MGRGIAAISTRACAPCLLSQPVFSTDNLRHRVKAASFRAASYLTYPVCKSHEMYRRLLIVDALHPNNAKIANLWRKFLLVMGVIVFGAIATLTSLPGIALRALTSEIQKEPYIYFKGDAASKVLDQDRTFSLLSWNICCVGGGYTISDGGVMPWPFRIDDIADKIAEKNADVNCIYETFDTESAFILCEKLKKMGYAHFYFNIGPKAVGLSSGIFVASKFAIQNPEFTIFPKDSLIGRTKSAAKGVFGMDLQSRGKTFATVFATHMQHSEECAFPTKEEVEARRKQMYVIIEKVKKVKDRCVVVTGDLNLDDEEYRKSSWHSLFEKGDCFKDPTRTWGGDGFCAALMKKRGSPSLNLDHTMIVKGSAKQIQTTLVETGYEGRKFKRKALSDHSGLLSRITV